MGLDIDVTKQSPLQEEVDGMHLNLLTLSGALYVAMSLPPPHSTPNFKSFIVFLFFLAPFPYESLPTGFLF